MQAMEIMEWTMGWAWPVIALLVVLMTWGIWRIINWDESGLSQAQSSDYDSDKHCVC